MALPVLPAIPLASVARLLTLTLRNGGIDWRRIGHFTLLLSRYTALEPIRLLERIALDGAVARHKRHHDPIFVIGHWRSGTSYLQQLLAFDPRFCTTTLYNTLFADIAGLTEPWLKPVMNTTARVLGLPHNLQRMPLTLDLVGEADVGLCCQLSPYAYTWGHVFPRRFQEWLDRCVLDPSPEHAEAWLDDLERYLNKLSWAAGGRRVVTKSPGDTGRLAFLAARFPEAKFVFIHRDPLAVFHSSRYLWQVIRREFSVQTVTDERVDDHIVATYTALLTRYLEQRGGIEAGRLTEIAFEDLRRDPLGALEQIYEDLGLGPVDAAMQTKLGEQTPHAPQPYDTPPDLEQRLRRAWAFSFDSWSRPS